MTRRRDDTFHRGASVLTHLARPNRWAFPAGSVPFNYISGGPFSGGRVQLVVVVVVVGGGGAGVWWDGNELAIGEFNVLAND